MKSLTIALMMFMTTHVSFGATTCYLNGQQLAKKVIPTGITLHNLKANGFTASAVIDASGIIRQMAIQDLEKQVKVFSSAMTQESDLSYLASQNIVLACVNK